MCKEKTPGELLAEELCYRTKNAGEELDAAELARADAFCEEYKDFPRPCKNRAGSGAHHRGNAGEGRVYRL
ncbi:MAG: hypothetical protein V8Q30_06340 [Acutalibacteraceae bacterium]